MGEFDGKVALVTGASRGIGRAIALRLAHEGAEVALVARDIDGERLGRSLAATVDEIRAVGGRAVALAGDLTDPSFRRASVGEQTEEHLGPIDILVNNAGMSPCNDDVTRAPPQGRTLRSRGGVAKVITLVSRPAALPAVQSTASRVIT